MKCLKTIPRWPWLVMFIMMALWLSAQDTTPLPPLTATQLTRVRELVHTTQKQSALLQARLAERQRELARVYATYELDETRAHKLQGQIVELQRELLANHHRLQIELRTLVSRERFDMLRRRLEQAGNAGVASPASRSSSSEKRP